MVTWLFLPFAFHVFSMLSNKTATATRTPQNNRFNEQKQSPCTCFIWFCAFLCRLEMTKFKVWWPFVENMSTWRWIFHFSSLLKRRSHQFSSRILRTHCTSWTNRNNREVVEVTRSYIFKWRFRYRCLRRRRSSSQMHVTQYLVRNIRVKHFNNFSDNVFSIFKYKNFLSKENNLVFYCTDRIQWRVCRNACNLAQSFRRTLCEQVGQWAQCSYLLLSSSVGLIDSMTLEQRSNASGLLFWGILERNTRCW